MDVLKFKKKHNLLFLLFVLLFSSACQIGYYSKSAFQQLSLLNKRQPMDEAIKSNNLSEENKRKLMISQEARAFAENKLHLKSSRNFSRYVQLDQPYITYVVSAAPKWELKHHLWSFLIVGDMPYKGYFNEQDAKEEEAFLQKKGLDTYMRGVSAFSSLGWFEEPLYSSMLNYKEHELVNTVIHELVHSTLYIKNNADFNERLAVFLGNKGMELFYLEKEGENSQTLRLIRDENLDDNLFSHFISKEIEELKNWYQVQNNKTEEIRNERLALIQKKFNEHIRPKLKTTNYSKFDSIKLNNARLLLYKTYMEDLSDFESLFLKVNGDFQKFISECKKLEREPQPENALKKLITRQSI